MVLYNWTGYRVLSIVYLDQLSGARHTHITNHDNAKKDLTIRCKKIQLFLTGHEPESDGF